MSNGRTEVHFIHADQQVKGRKILSMQALTAIVFGVIVLAHEIAVLVLWMHDLGRPIQTEQIIATSAALAAVIAGVACYLPSRLTAPLDTLRRSFIISAVFSLIATVLLAVTQGLYAPRAWNLWHWANSTPSNFLFGSPDSNHLDSSAFASVFPSGGEGGSYFSLGLSYNAQYYLKVVAILKIVALLGGGILVVATLICTILSIVNVLRRRGNYQPAPIHDQNHGTRVYYDKNSS